MTMPCGTRFRPWLAGLFTAALLAACGGGDDLVPGQDGPRGAPTELAAFEKVIVFGDSLSDGGTYTIATSATADLQPPYLGGRFTTNLTGVANQVWPELVAAELGLSVTPAVTGIRVSGNEILTDCPTSDTCTNYAQGGARVTEAQGIGYDAGFLTHPISGQIARHLARNDDTFSSTDLVAVWGGANEVLVEANNFGTAAATIATDLANGDITATEASRLQFEALQSAQAGVKVAALKLAALIKSQIVAKGARYVLVMNLPDVGLTPRGLAAGTSGSAAISSIAETYNLWLRTGLADVPVQLFDVYAFFRTVVASPATYGFTNVTGVACDLTSPRTSSLLCNGTTGSPFNNLVSGATPTTYLFADDVHPTTGGHAQLAEAVMTALRSYGWVAPD